MKKETLHFHIVSLFPDAFTSYIQSSIIGRAITDGKLAVSLYNPRDFTKDTHHRVDRRPYGGGPGMVLEAKPIIQAVKKAVGRKKNVKIVILSPAGKQFTNEYARRVSKKYTHIVLIAGHYEGLDARVKKITKAEEVTIGPYILTGGELPAMVMIDVIARQVPNILGNHGSLEEERTASPEIYTRPEILLHGGKKYRVPKILLSGHHKNIEEWKVTKINKKE